MSALFDIVGNLVADPESKTSPSGKSIANFSVAYSPTRRDGSKGEVSFYNVTAWERLADNVMATLRKGDRVQVAGRVTQDRWETEDGTKRSKHVFTADEIGVSLMFASADITRNPRAEENGTAAEVAADEFVV